MSDVPPIAAIATCTDAHLRDAVHRLSRSLARVRGSRRQRLADDDDDDNISRAYAIRWLTALIAQLDARPADLIERATSLLAVSAGIAAAGTVQRQFAFASPLGEIHVALTDVPLDNRDYAASVGAQTWGSACVLAELVAERPHQFGLQHRPLRVLELGAGTGLVGLTVAKLLQASPRQATVVLSDHYPTVLANLQSNLSANFPSLSDSPVHVHIHALDWSDYSTTKTIPDTLTTHFDIVLGADIVYEAQHAIWIRDCLLSLLAYPHGSTLQPVFHLVVPLRSTHTFESSTVEDVFASKHHASERALVIFSRESIVCEAHGDDGGADDVEYIYYRIGWDRT